MSKDITDQEFKKTVLLGLQVCSSHLCALALGSKVPNPNYNKPMSNLSEATNPTGKQKDKRVFVPMGIESQIWHAGAQQQLNQMIDTLVGTDEENEGLAPTPVDLAESVPDNVVRLKLDGDPPDQMLTDE